MDFNLKEGAKFILGGKTHTIKKVFKKHVRLDSGQSVSKDEVGDYLAAKSYKYIEKILSVAFERLGQKPEFEIDGPILMVTDVFGIFGKWKENKIYWELAGIHVTHGNREEPDCYDDIVLGSYEDIYELIEAIMFHCVLLWSDLRGIMDYADLEADTTIEFQEVMSLIRERCAAAKLAPEGEVYLRALENTAKQYGESGLRHQVEYILSNGRFKKDDRRALEKYARKGDITALIGG